MSKLTRYGELPNSHDLLKVAGVVLFIIDHLGLYIYPEQIWLRVVGRLAAPIFFFLVGYSRSNRLYPSLFIYGFLLSMLGYYLSHVLRLNILINICLIRIVLSLVDLKQLTDFMLAVFFAGTILLGLKFNYYLEYGLSGLLIVSSARLKAAGDSRANALLFVALSLYFMSQLYIFNFVSHFNEWFILALLLMMLSLSFMKYSMRSYTLSALRLPVLLCSRYSLQVYFWPLFFFKIAQILVSLQTV